MFDRREVRMETLRTMARLQTLGGSISGQALEANRSERLGFAREEIWHTGGGSLNRDLDCSGCKHSGSCPGDECLRKS